MSFHCLSRWVSCLFIVLLAGSNGFAAEAQPIAGDIAAAGHVRMQAQRLAKLYFQIGLKVNVSAAERQIDLAQRQVDVDFRRLETYARKPAFQRTLVRCDTAWLELRGLVRKPVSAAHLERAAQLAEELSIHAGKLAMQIEAEAETPVARLLDLSSRQNMLAQRLARLYMQLQSGEQARGLLVDLEQTRKEFAAGLNAIESAAEGSPASRDALVLAKNQWVFLDTAVSQLRASSFDAKAVQHVASSSERIQEMLAAVTAQYLQDYGVAPRQVR